MLIKNLKCTFGKIFRLVIRACLLAGLMFPGIRTHAVKASPEPSAGPASVQNSPVAAVPEYTLTITSDHGTVTKSPDQPTYHAGDVVHLTHTDNPGWKFDSWSYTGTGAQIYPPGAVAISFDDGYLSTYTNIYPYLKSKGVPATLYLICSWANQSWSLSTAQLNEMSVNGWSIANHTTGHMYLDTRTETQQEAELQSCKNYLNGIGLTKASSYVAYPYGVFNTDTLTAMTNTGMVTGRTTDSATFDPKNVYLLEIPSGSDGTLDYVEQMTDYAVAHHQIFLYFGHEIGQPGELSLADFETWIDYLKLNNIPTLSINDVYARTFSPIDITITGNTSITANYTKTSTISGNAGIAGAVVNHTGGSPVVADASGNYTITVPYGWIGTVSPSKLGYTFTPPSRYYSDVTINPTGQDYTATATNNMPPVIIGGEWASVTMSENGVPTPFALTMNAMDFDASDTLTWSISNPALYGTASAEGTGFSKAIGYTPPTDYVGSDRFTVQVSDGKATDTMTVTVTIVASPIYLLSVTENGSGTVESTPQGIDCGATCSASFDYNTSVTLIATAAAGWTFTGWSGEGCSGTGTCIVTMSTARSVTAAFTLNTYALTVNKAGNGSGTVTSSPTGINCGGSCSHNYDYNTTVTLTATPTTSSNFTGWSGGVCSGTGTCDVSVTAAKTVTATFTLKTFLLTVIPAGNGSGTVTSSPDGINCGATCSASFDYNTSVTLTATPATGSTFTGWSGEGCSGTGTCTVMMSTTRSVAATFILNTYLLTVNKTGTGSGTVTSSPAGINCGGTCSAPYNYNTTVRLTATPAANSDFTSWSGGGCSGAGTCDVSVTDAKAVTATFTLKTFLLTVSPAGNGSGTVTSSPDGINCGGTCSASYDINTSVTLTAVAATGSTFTGWSGEGCSGTGTCEVSMNTAKTVTATFTLNKYLLTVTPAGDGSGAVTSSPDGIDCGTTCSASYDYNTTVTLTAVAAPGSTFVGWSGGGCSGTGTCDVSMTDVSSVTATFNLIRYWIWLPRINR